MSDGWAWCRLRTIGEYKKGPFGSSLTKAMFVPKSENTVKVYEQKNAIQKDHTLGEYYITRDYFESQMQGFEVFPGDILVSCAGTIGETYILPDNIEQGIINQALMKMKITPLINTDYFLMFFDHILKGESENNGKGTAIKNIPPFDIFKNFLFPLPSYSEQKRIIESVKIIFSIIDNLENDKADLYSLITSAKSKILDLAIHGKLVPQDPNDEPAEELLKRIATSDNRPYKKIYEDEALFDIPESWSWCTLGEIYTHTTGKALKKTNNKGTLRKYITTSNLYWNSFDFTEVREMYFTDDELEKCTIKKGDLILCNGGDVGRAAIWNYDYDICYQNHVSRLRPKNKNINNSFFLYVIMIYKQQGILNGKGVGITSLSASDLLSAVVPLPPYSEQNRIVEKIECLYGNLTIINNQL